MSLNGKKTKRAIVGSATAYSTLRQSMGASLIEVMITFVIIASGLIGAVAMQLHSLKNINASIEYEQKVELQNELSELMVSFGDDTAAIDNFLSQRKIANEIDFILVGNTYTVTIFNDSKYGENIDFEYSVPPI